MHKDFFHCAMHESTINRNTKENKNCLNETSFIYISVSKVICMLDGRWKCNVMSHKAYRRPHFCSIWAGGRFVKKSAGWGSFVVVLSVPVLPQLLVGERQGRARKGRTCDGWSWIRRKECDSLGKAGASEKAVTVAVTGEGKRWRRTEKGV